MITGSHPPGPPARWLLGHVGEFRRDMLGFYRRISREYGDFVAFRLGPRRLVLVAHPDAIEQIVVTENRNFVKPYIYEFLRPVLGNGLLLSRGDFWLRQRKLMQPAFLRQRIESYGPLMVEATERMLAGWHDGATRDVHADMMHLALAIAARAFMDVDITGDARCVALALDCLMEDFSYRFESAFPLPRWLPLPRNLRFRRAVRQLDQLMERIIHERRTASHADLLSRLIAARDDEGGAGMTDQQLRDELITLLLAGHETTANALTWTWYLLAQHPHVADKLEAQLRDGLGERPPTVADLDRLPYAEWIILESMRLYPPVYAISRKPVQDCTLGGYHITADTTLILCQWLVQRDPRFFDDPESFRPERWGEAPLSATPLPDGDHEPRKLPKYAYFPFGGGPHICIGNSFAMLEATLVLATIASRCRFTLVRDHPVLAWPSVTLRPLHGIKVMVHHRQ